MKKIFLVFMFGGLLFSCQENQSNSTKSETTKIQSAAMISNTNKTTSAAQEDVWLESLITDTPQEGRELAIQMARKTIGAMQKDSEVKKRLRAEYSENPQHLILASQVVATEFKTVAEANNYWKK
ncbi:MAG TPA: hexameric tyrosine-coordinated heme protein [Flavobacteriaceae bacterium]|nr:hexameric tyrosine-coordinated heme protein [Flavobacteriaceae bacterium]